MGKYGGHKTRKEPKNEKHSVTYRWKITGPRLGDFCKDVLPSLLIKRKQAETVLSFLKIRENDTTNAVTDSQRLEQEHYRGIIMELNTKGVGDIQHRQLIAGNVKEG
ncbi:hypothetical protein PMW_01 [Pseudomonas phage phiPMW]|uniref:Uncharacterized protein n=1 Tax=Pseudomonas phage phiPMW TaxID=1815582 RepID=A0A1S5R142_9CAUD|nr:HNH endonuclease [Pseudomonas phage phiPMW]ANA49126.1 hypothetical protein PMW_01 [Pseudomonas phage phiPMW]